MKFFYSIFFLFCFLSGNSQVWPTYTSPSGVNAYVTGGIDYYVNNPNSPNAQHVYNVSVTGEIIPMQVTNRNVERLWAAGITGTGIKVGVMDGGIILSNNITVSGGICVTNTDSTYAYDEDGHGTKMAYIIADKHNGAEGISGIAPGVDLFIIRANTSFSGKPYHGIENNWDAGIQAAIDNGVNILNISLDVHPTTAYLNAAISAGMIIIASAGNRPMDSAPEQIKHPAADPGVVAVGSNQGGHVFKESDTLGHNSIVPVNGKGLDFLVCPVIISKNRNVYAADYGTSQGAAIVTSYFALLMQWAKRKSLIMKPYQYVDYMKKFTTSTYQGYRRFTNFDKLNLN